MRGRNLTVLAFVLVCGIIAYYDIRKCQKLPWPPRFIYAGIAFIITDIFGSMIDERLSGVMSIGFVIATFMKEGFHASCQETTTGTGQPQLTAFMGTSQPGATGSVAEFEQQTAQSTQGSTPYGAAPAMPPGTTVQ